MFCKHHWQVLSETTTKSGLEKMKALGRVPKDSVEICWVEQKFIQIIACKKCGKLKRYVTTV